MRLPFMQLESDFLAHGASELSHLARCSVAQAIGHVSLLRAWAVSHATDDAPPDGWVGGDSAERRVEAAAQWNGPEGVLLMALADAGQVRREPGGVRVLHLQPYVEAWNKNRTAKERMRNMRERSANKRERSEHRDDTSSERSAKFTQQTQTQKEEKKEALSASADLQVPLLQVGPISAMDSPEALQALWNDEAHPSLPRWQGMSDARKRRAAARLRERSLQSWREVIRRLSASTFCRGEEGGSWRATPDWLLQPDVAEKVLEGKYDRAGATAARSAGAGGAAVGEECAICSRVGDGANLQQPGRERLWLGYACGCCSGWTAEIQGGRHYSDVYEWARERRAGRAA